MKRSDRRLLEEKLRYVAMEDIELDPERERQMLEAARAKFMQQSAEKDADQTSGRHKMGRRVLIVSAAAVLLLVLSFGFTVLMPESVSQAKGFVRTAAIWVNDTLHLGYEFEEPTATPVSLSNGEDITYATIEEAAANIPYPLVYLDDPLFKLQSVIVQNTSPYLVIKIIYQRESQECVIALSPASYDTITYLDGTTHTDTLWQGGELECWKGSSSNYALTYYAGMEITIKCKDIPYSDFLSLCQTLKVFN